MPVNLQICNPESQSFEDAKKTLESTVKPFITIKQAEALRKEGQKKGQNSSQSVQEGSNKPAYHEDLIAVELDVQLGASLHFRDNGLVHALEAAYSQHQHLILRPDDIWLCILTQFSIYVNKHAEELRSQFVDHEGQKQWHTQLTYICHDAREMALLLGENVKDPSLLEWIIPNFTTTTETDITVASITMMATFQAYFTYLFTLRCGIPSVTLQGTREDWVSLRARIERFEEFGHQPTKWAKLLRPVCDSFIACFDAPSDAAIHKKCVDFWSRVCHYIPQGSGPTYLCGWATVFCVWSEEGDWRGDIGQYHPAQRYPVKDLTDWPAIDAQKIPRSVAEVPVTVDNNGDVFKTTMLAGLPGITHTKRAAGDGGTITPAVGWGMFRLP